MVYDDCVFLVVDLYRVCGNFAGEAQESHAHSTLSHTLLTDHCNASESPEHNIISVSPYYDKRIILDAYAYVPMVPTHLPASPPHYMIPLPH